MQVKASLKKQETSALTRLTRYTDKFVSDHPAIRDVMGAAFPTQIRKLFANRNLLFFSQGARTNIWTSTVFALVRKVLFQRFTIFQSPQPIVQFQR